MLRKKAFNLPYLQGPNGGNTRGSQGLPVAILQTIILTMQLCLKEEINPTGKPITISGYYDEKTKRAVKKLQTILGLSGKDVDGHFGPITRKALLEWSNGRLDVKKIPRSAFEIVTFEIQPGKNEIDTDC